MLIDCLDGYKLYLLNNEFAVASPSKREALTGLRLGYLWRDPANMALVEPDSNPGFRKCFFIYRPIFWL